MNRKIWAIALAASLSAVSFAGCAAPKPAPSPSEAPAATDAVEATEAPVEQATDAPADNTATGEKPYIAIISKGFQHQFWQAVKAGADKAADELGVSITFEGPEAETEVAKQMEMLTDALSKNPAAICLAALDSTAVVPQLEECKSKNIPVVGFDSGVDSDIPVATCATNNKAAAAAAADKMAELLGGKGEVFVIVHDQTSITGKDRRDGFLEQIATYPDIKVVGVDYGDGNADKSEQIVANAITANPELKGIFGANEGSAIGAVNAVQKSGKTDLVLIGFDSGKLQKEAVRSGLMAGAISQDPVSIGYQAVKTAVAASKGEAVPEKLIDTGFKWYDKNNIDDPDIAAVLYD